MKQLKSIVILSLALSIIAGQASADQSSPNELVSVAAPNYRIEHQTVHFSQAIAKGSRLGKSAQKYTNISDEFWLEVSGQALNNGINLHVSQPQALIRLTAKRQPGSWLPDNHAINPAAIKIFKRNKAINNAFTHKVTKEQYATANIFPNSSAVQLSKNAGSGLFQLQVTDSLSPHQRYLINVKEKGSRYIQRLSVAKQNFVKGRKISFNLALISDDIPLTDVRHQAFIKTPLGENHEVILERKKEKFVFDMPHHEQQDSYGALYELHVTSQWQDGGTQVRRDGKFAFSLVTPTASIANLGSITAAGLPLSLNVASEGRYEVSGVVYGLNKKGRYRPIMRSHSAYFLTSGQQSIVIAFDQEILNRSSFKAPYQLRRLSLKDQSRMAVLSTR